MHLGLAVLCVACAAACSPAQRTHLNRGALVASTALLACDWAQTHRAAAIGWRTESGGERYILEEENPVLGTAPSVEAVGAYFLVAAAANVAIWAVMPDRYKSAVPLAVVAVQAPAISGNREMLGMCGR